jgi:hypothetical protein
MNRIKLFVVTLVLCATGVVYAANDHAKHQTHSCPAGKAAAGCCADHKHSGAKADKKESCCQPGASCCAARKPGDKKTAEQAKHEGGESCCVAGAECCAGGDCCAKHKR